MRDKLEQIHYLRNEGRKILGPLNIEMESIKAFEKSIQAHLQESEQLSEEGLVIEKKALLKEYLDELRQVLNLVPPRHDSSL